MSLNLVNGQIQIVPRQVITLPASGSKELQDLMDMRSTSRSPIQNAMYKNVALINWQARGKFVSEQLKAGKTYADLSTPDGINAILAAEPLQYVHRSLPRNIFGQGHDRPSGFAVFGAQAAPVAQAPVDPIKALASLSIEQMEQVVAMRRAMESKPATATDVQNAATTVAEPAPTTPIAELTDEQLEAATNPAA